MLEYAVSKELGLLCYNVNSAPMCKRLFDDDIHGLPHPHVAEQAYGVLVLPARELVRVVRLGPAHGRDLISVCGDRADDGTA
jgi:hypothetical protein